MSDTKDQKHRHPFLCFGHNVICLSYKGNNYTYTYDPKEVLRFSKEKHKYDIENGYCAVEVDGRIVRGEDTDCKFVDFTFEWVKNNPPLSFITQSDKS